MQVVPNQVYPTGAATCSMFTPALIRDLVKVGSYLYPDIGSASVLPTVPPMAQGLYFGSACFLPL